MQSAEATTTLFTCIECGQTFPSRNKLFRHLKETEEDHAMQKDENEDFKSKPQLKRQKSASTVPSSSTAADEGLKILQEDDWYGVIVKPQGLATHGEEGITVMSSDKMLLPDAIKLEMKYKKLFPCHRLDKETGGVMVCSKTKLAERAIMASFKQGLVHKRYRAIISGKLEPIEGMISSPISGKEARTRYSVVCYTRSLQYDWVTTVDLWPLTGRNHQLRRHMQSIDHPILGDKRYSFAKQWPSLNSPMFLWALEVNFPHPQHCTHLIHLPPPSPGVNDNKSSSTVDIDVDVVTGGSGKKKTTTATSTSSTAAGILIDNTTAIDKHRIIVTIDEPIYFANFREGHAAAWNQEQKE